MYRWESWITGWVPQNWCFWTVVPEKTLESPLDSKGDQTVNPKGNQPWIFIWRTDLKLKLQYFGHLIVKSLLTEKDTDAGKKLKAKGERGDRGWDGWMASLTQWTWIEQTLGQSRGQRSLACCSHGVAKSRTWLSDWTKNTLQPIHSNKFSGLV